MKIVMMKKCFMLISLITINSLFCMQDSPDLLQQLLTKMEEALNSQNFYIFNKAILDLRKYLSKQPHSEKLSTCYDLTQKTKNPTIQAKLLLIAMGIYTSNNGKTQEEVGDALCNGLSNFYSSNHSDPLFSTNQQTLGDYHRYLKDFMRNHGDKKKADKKRNMPCNHRATLINHQRIFRGLSNGRIKIYDPRQEYIQTLDRFNTGPEQGHHEPITALDLYNGRYLISGSLDETVKVWDIEDASCHQTVRTTEVLHDRRNVTAVLAGYKKLLVAGTLDGTLYFMDNAKYAIQEEPFFKTRSTLTLHDEKVSDLQMVDNDTFISSSYDGTCILIDANGLQQVHTHKHNGKVNSVSTINDSLFMSVVNDYTVELWNTQQNSPVNSFHVAWPIQAFANNPKFIALGLKGGAIKVWDIQQGVFRAMKHAAQPSCFKALALDDENENRLQVFTQDNTFHEIGLFE
jgi:WD40 repeat protein